MTRSPDIGRAVEKRIERLRGPGMATTAGYLAKAIVFAMCLHPEPHWIPSGLPGLGLGLTRYAPDFAIEHESPWIAALAATMPSRLPAIKTARVATAALHSRGLPALDALAPVTSAPGAEPSSLRSPFPVADDTLRTRLLSEFCRTGIGASGSYPRPIADISELRHMFPSAPNADAGRNVARRILTSPPHPSVLGRDAKRAHHTITRAARSNW